MDPNQTLLALQVPGTTDVIEDPLNPAIVGPIQRTGSFTSLGAIITTLIPYVYVAAGLILFFSFIWGGFTLLTAAGNPDSVAKGKQIITASFIGFVIIFTSFWLMKVLELAFGLKLGF